MIFFSIEILLCTFVQKDYFLGFYFFLDLIGTISLILDINWITNDIYGTLSESNT